MKWWRPVYWLMWATLNAALTMEMIHLGEWQAAVGDGVSVVLLCGAWLLDKRFRVTT